MYTKIFIIKKDPKELHQHFPITLWMFPFCGPVSLLSLRMSQMFQNIFSALRCVSIILCENKSSSAFEFGSAEIKPKLKKRFNLQNLKILKWTEARLKHVLLQKILIVQLK